MTADDEKRLAAYEFLSWLDEPHQVALVQHRATHRVYVRKVLTMFHTDVFSRLKRQPAIGMPVIYEAVEHNGMLIVIEEYITGTPLSEILFNRGTLPDAQAAAVVRRILVTLSCLHAMTPPIVHRDVKPENIILTPDGRTILLDLDAAKGYDRRESRDTEFIGTQGYAAPEQYGFGPSSPQTDIYAAGVLLNVCLTGMFPQDMTVFGPLGAVVKRCTAMDPADRYPNAAAVITALDFITGGGAASPQARTAPEPEPDTASSRDAARDPLTTGWQSWLPPGFRSPYPLYWIFSGACYFFCLWITTGFNIEGYDLTMIVWARIFTTLFFLMAVFFAGNWRGVQEKWFLTAGRRGFERFIGVAGTVVLIIALFFVLMFWIGGAFSGSHIVEK